MKRLLISALLLSSPSWSHDDDHDWRQDYEAYLNIQYELPLIRSQEKSRLNFKAPRINMGNFKKNLSILSGAEKIPGTDKIISERGTSANLDLAREFLANEYKKLGFEVSFQPFMSGSNLIAEKKGTKNPEKVLILSSHIDSVGNNGANDNGTGTIGALAIAEAMSKKEYDYTIRILGFDREEKGMKGSIAYVVTIPDKKQVIGNINLEMMGVNSKNDGAFHVIDCDSSLFGRNIMRKESEFLSKEVKESIATLNENLTVVKTCTGRSDHASFWKHNIPAIVISENFFGGDPDPCYHARCDVLDERLNYGYMENILEVLLHTTEKLLKEK